MRNPLTIRIETHVGVAILLFWATLFIVVILRSISSFSSFLALMHAQTPLTKTVARAEHDQINRWLKAERLNAYGDATDTVYAGGTPLFDEETGKSIDRYTYLVRKFPERPWRPHAE